MALPDEARPFARFWGAAVAAVNQRVDTSGFWQAIRSAAESSGLQLPPGGFRAITQLRSAAVRQREATAAFQTLPDSAVLSPVVAPTAIWSRDLETMAMFPKLQATVEVTTVGPNGELATRPLTINNIEYVPYMTAGELRDVISSGVEGLVSNYALGDLVDVGEPSVAAY